jgi:galactokinase
MKSLADAGIVFWGFEGVICGDVPIASGLSSSAAIEVATAFGLDMAFGLGLDPVRLGRRRKSA